MQKGLSIGCDRPRRVTAIVEMWGTSKDTSSATMNRRCAIRSLTSSPGTARRGATSGAEKCP